MLPLNFHVQYLEGGQVIWLRGREKGVPVGQSCTTYAQDGTLQKVKAALQEALIEVEGQLLCFNPVD